MMPRTTIGTWTAVAIASACASRVEPPHDADKRAIDEYSSVDVRVVAEEHIHVERPEGWSSGVGNLQLPIRSRQDGDHLTIELTEARFQISESSKAIELSVRDGWVTDFGMEVLVMSGEEELVALYPAPGEFSFWTKIRIDRQLAAVRGRWRTYSTRQDGSEAGALPLRAIAENDGPLEVRVRIWPVDTIGELGGRWGDAEYRPEITWRELSDELPFTALHTERREGESGGARKQIVTEGIRPNGTIASLHLVYTDDDDDQMPDPNAGYEMRLYETPVVPREPVLVHQSNFDLRQDEQGRVTTELVSQSGSILSHDESQYLLEALQVELGNGLSFEGLTPTATGEDLVLACRGVGALLGGAAIVMGGALSLFGTAALLGYTSSVSLFAFLGHWAAITATSPFVLELIAGGAAVATAAYELCRYAQPIGDYLTREHEYALTFEP